MFRSSRLAPARWRRYLRLGAAVAMVALAMPVAPAGAAVFVPISGAGSTWSQNALDQWRRNVTQYGMQINYQGTGSSDGRNQFRNGTVDFAVSEIPYGLTDSGVVDYPPARKYAYMPIVAGGTAFMYNLKISGQRVTNLRLSGRDRHQDLHRRDQAVERPGHQGRQPGAAAAGPPGRAGGPLGRLRHHRPVHALDEQAVRVAVERLLRPGRPAHPVRAHVGVPGHPWKRFHRPGRFARRFRLRRPGPQRGRDHLRRVLVRAERRLPDRQAAQQGRLLRRAEREQRRGGAAGGRGSTGT